MVEQFEPSVVYLSLGPSSRIPLDGSDPEDVYSGSVPMAAHGTVKITTDYPVFITASDAGHDYVVVNGPYEGQMYWRGPGRVDIVIGISEDKNPRDNVVRLMVPLHTLVLSDTPSVKVDEYSRPFVELMNVYKG